MAVTMRAICFADFFFGSPPAGIIVISSSFFREGSEGFCIGGKKTRDFHFYF